MINNHIEEGLYKKKKKQLKTEFRFKPKGSKEYLWLEETVHTTYNKKGDITETTTVLRDVTKNKKIELHLKENEEKYRNIFTQNLAGVFITEKGKIIECNNSFAKIFGYTSRVQLIGKDAEVLYFTKKSRQLYLKDLEQNKKLTNYKIKHKKKDGTELWILTNVTKKGIRVEGTLIEITEEVRKEELENEKIKALAAEKSNKKLQKEIEERKNIEYKLIENQKYTKSIIESSIDIICASDVKGNIIEFNKSGLEIFGYDNEELKKIKAQALYANRADFYTVGKELKNKGIFIGEVKNKRKNGEIFTSFLSASVLYDQQGNHIGSMGVSRDITEQKIATERLADSLKEKEVLLKEVHHRVKNNLQVISSILNLQSSYVKEESILNILRESQNRIKSMSFIHESLYQSNDFSQINFSEYVISLSKNLVHSYGVFDNFVKLELQVENVSLNLDQSIPCGLLINELVSNALKYGFPDKKKGTITIELFEKNEYLHLMVKDDGVGMPSTINYKETDTLGLQLVMTLVEQIGGTIKLENVAGTEYTLIFKKEQNVEK